MIKMHIFRVVSVLALGTILLLGGGPPPLLGAGPPTIPIARLPTGTSSGQIPVLGSGGILANAQMQGNIGVEVDLFYSGVPGNSAFLNKVFTRVTVVAASAPIKCAAKEGATSSATVTLYHVVSGSPTSIGTLVFGASGGAYQGCTATFSSPITFAAGDTLAMVFPGSADATLGDVAVSIPATQ